MLFIIEGCDLTGKTRLATRLCREIRPRVRYLHAGRPRGHPIDEYAAPLASYRPGEHVVLDRWHLGELVWPTVFNRVTALDPPTFLYLELFLQSRGAMLIFACRNRDTLTMALAAKPDEPITINQLDLVEDLFELALERTLLPIVEYDFESKYTTRAVETAYKIASVLDKTVRTPLEVSTEWVGSPRPNVLLVGDRFNGAGPTPALAVPFVPRRGTSGHFLMEELLTRELTNVAICNSIRGDGAPERLVDLIAALNSPAVVALGRCAENELMRVGVPHVAVPHPQYSRRFERARGLGAYGNRILTALEGMKR